MEIDELSFLLEVNVELKETQEFLVWLDSELEKECGEGHGYFIGDLISKVTDRIKKLDVEQKDGE